jgi:DNA-binding LacI/PurR family transcriptional regulator
VDVVLPSQAAPPADTVPPHDAFKPLDTLPSSKAFEPADAVPASDAAPPAKAFELTDAVPASDAAPPAKAFELTDSVPPARAFELTDSVPPAKAFPPADGPKPAEALAPTGGWKPAGTRHANRGPLSTRERPTLEAVARIAGVSRATVSRVVNGSSSVTPAIRETVTRVVDELGYVPNQAARSLVTQRTESIALILPETANRVFSDDLFFPAIVRGVSAELEAADKQLVLMMTGSPASAVRVHRYAVSGHVDGVMFASMHGVDPLPGALTRLGIPVICSGRPIGSDVPYVDVDHFGGVRRAVSYLVESGRRRIATIAGPQDMMAGIERLAGYRATLDEAGLAHHVAMGDFARESGVRAMRELLSDDPDLDAVFIASDMMAHGALQALKDAGRRIPDDVAVIGFDDFELSRYSDPPLTTVRQPIADMGRAMAQHLLARINGAPDLPMTVVLPTELVIRGSA